MVTVSWWGLDLIYLFLQMFFINSKKMVEPKKWWTHGLEKFMKNVVRFLLLGFTRKLCLVGIFFVVSSSAWCTELPFLCYLWGTTDSSGTPLKSDQKTGINIFTTVDGRNPANQLRLVVFPIIYRVSYILGGCLGFQPSTLL